MMTKTPRTTPNIRALAPALVALAVGLAALTSAPQEAHALLGVEGIWAPVGSDKLSTDDTLLDPSPDRDLSSFGAGIYVEFGIPFVGLGLKLNYLQNPYSEEVYDYSQIDVNALVTIGFIPVVDLRLEAGPSFSTTVSGVGYNVGGAITYPLVDLPFVTPYIGLGGSYFSVPHQIEPTPGSLEEIQYDGVRLLVTLGVDLSLF